VPSSGSAGNPITIGAYGTGEKPIIQPTTKLSGWTEYSTNIYYATWTGSTPVQLFVDGVFVRPSFWPSTIDDNHPVFAYPSANSGNDTTLKVDALDGTPAADLVGATLIIFKNDYIVNTAAVSAWNDSTNILTVSSLGFNPTTSMRMYLTNQKSFITENTWAYVSGEQRIYLYTTGGGDPDGKTVDVTVAANRSIYAEDKSYVIIDGINSKFAGFGIDITNWAQDSYGVQVLNNKVDYPYSYGIIVYPKSWMNGYYMDGSYISGNTVDHAQGPSIFSGWARNVCGDIKNNTITNAGGISPRLPGTESALWSMNPCVVDNNTINYSSYNGILIDSNDTAITNNTISNTNLFGNNDGGAIYLASNNHVMSGNNITNGGYGLYADQGSSNITMNNNTVTGGTRAVLLHFTPNADVHNNKFVGPFTEHYALQASDDGTVTGTNIYYNIIDCKDSTAYGISLAEGASSGVDVYNNTVVNCGYGLYAKDVSAGVANIKNNIFYNNVTHIIVTSGDVTNMDYNLYYPDTGTRFNWNNTNYNFANWKTNSSMDANSPVPADPLFVPSSNFYLQSGSPAIDAGEKVNLTTSDYLGNPVPFGSGPDIGAYEYTSLSPPPNIPYPPDPPSNLRILP
jgi:parallel beta-helix repeat protein